MPASFDSLLAQLAHVPDPRRTRTALSVSVAPWPGGSRHVTWSNKLARYLGLGALSLATVVATAWLSHRTVSSAQHGMECYG